MEISRRLSNDFPVDLCVFSFEDNHDLGEWGKDYRVSKFLPKKIRPLFLKQLYYQLISPIQLRLLPKLKSQKKLLIHSTGICTPVGDIFQVQFIHTAWKKRQADLDRYGIDYGKSSASLKGIYHQALLEYNVILERLIYTPDKYFIAISNQVKRDLMTYFLIPSDKIRVIHHGVDYKIFHPLSEASQDEALEAEKIRSENGLSADDFAFLFVGSFERKGLSFVIEAFGELLKDLDSPDSLDSLDSSDLSNSQGYSGKKPFLLVAGSGDESKYLSLAQSLGVAEQVHFLGSRKDIENVYRAANAFVMPTFYEAFGLVILEAMASALSVIVPGDAGGAELIENGKSGVLLKNPADSHEITQAMKKIFSNPELAKTLGMNASEVARQRSWDQVSKEYADFISEVTSDISNQEITQREKSK